MTSLRLPAAFLAVSAAVGPCSLSQEPQASPAPRFKEAVTVSRVLLDLRVVDDSGRPVAGLTRENLEVEVDGRPVALESLRWIDAGAARAPSDMPAETVDPAIEDIVVYADHDDVPAARAPAGRLLVLLFQKDLSVSARIPGLLKMTRRAAEWMQRLQPGDKVAVLSFDSQLHAFLDFTSDRARLARTLAHDVVMETPLHVDPGEAPSLLEHFDRAAARRAANLESALLVIGRALVELPGPKSLVLFAGGMGRLSGGLVIPENDYGPAIAALTAARTTVFSLDFTEADTHTLEVGLQAVAGDTGGTFAKTYNFPGVAMSLLERTLSGHYELAFEAPPNRGQHALKVKLVGRKGNVLARPTFES